MHQRHGTAIITQECQQCLFINSICYLSPPACFFSGEKNHSGSIEKSISDGSHAAFMIHRGEKRQIILRILKSFWLQVWISNIMANYDIPYAMIQSASTSTTGWSAKTKKAIYVDLFQSILFFSTIL